MIDAVPHDSSDYNWFDSEGQHDVELPHERDPRTYPWGMFTRDDSVLAPVGMFLWFSSPEELAAYVHEVEPRIYDLDDQERTKVQGDIAAPLAELTSSDADLEGARVALNAAQDYFTTDWWGTFDVLCTGDGEWEKEPRAESRPDDDGAEADRPIGPDEADAFIEYLGHYGY